MTVPRDLARIVKKLAGVLWWTLVSWARRGWDAMEPRCLRCGERLAEFAAPDGGPGGLCSACARDEGLVRTSELSGAEDHPAVRMLGPVGDDDVPVCRVCGCTDEAPCAGGCEWVPDPAMAGDLCSACALQQLVSSSGWKALQVLQDARRRLTSPYRWVQHAAAHDPGGSNVASLSPSAVATDLPTAIERAAIDMFDDWARVLPTALGVLAREMHGATCPSDRADLEAWQDKASHGEVLALLDAAIGRFAGQLARAGGEADHAG